MYLNTPRITPAGTSNEPFRFAATTDAREEPRRYRQPSSHSLISTIPVAPHAIINHAQNTILDFGSLASRDIQTVLEETANVMLTHAIGSAHDVIADPLQQCVAQHAAAIKEVAQREEHIFRAVDKACAAYASDRARLITEFESLLSVLQRETSGTSETENGKVVDAIASDCRAQLEELANSAAVTAHGRLATFLSKR